MKKNITKASYTAILFLLAFLLSSCTVVRENTEEPVKLKNALEEIRKNKAGGKSKTEAQNTGKDEAKILEEYKYGRKLVKAFIAGESRTFVKLLPARLQKEFDHKKFEATRKAVMDSMGEPVSYRYITALEMTSVTPHIWAIRFSRISRDEKEEYFSEMLFRVITGTLDGKPYIIGFNFF